MVMVFFPLVMVTFAGATSRLRLFEMQLQRNSNEIFNSINEAETCGKIFEIHCHRCILSQAWRSSSPPRINISAKVSAFMARVHNFFSEYQGTKLRKDRGRLPGSVDVMACRKRGWTFRICSIPLRLVRRAISELVSSNTAPHVHHSMNSRRTSTHLLSEHYEITARAYIKLSARSFVGITRMHA